LTMNNRVLIASALFVALMPLSAHAQGVPGGVAYGAAVGNQAAGPVGAVVGGAVGGVVGGVQGVLGINPYYYPNQGRVYYRRYSRR
jgi:hypothetical protein